MLRRRGDGIRLQPGGYLAGGLCSAAGVIVIGGGCGAGFFAFGFAAGSSPAAAAADAGAALDFGLVAGASPEDTAAVEDAPSFSAVDLRFGFAAGALDVVADAPSLSCAAVLITAVLFFSGFESPDACAGAGGGLVPV